MKAKSLPPWLQDKAETAKGTKVAAAKGPKGSVAKVVPPKKMADGGKVEMGKRNPASAPKKESRSDPKMSGNAKGNVLHLKDGGKKG